VVAAVGVAVAVPGLALAVLTLPAALSAFGAPFGCVAFAAVAAIAALAASDDAARAVAALAALAALAAAEAPGTDGAAAEIAAYKAPNAAHSETHNDTTGFMTDQLVGPRPSALDCIGHCANSVCRTSARKWKRIATICYSTATRSFPCIRKIRRDLE
jgi:hypothetical protein